MPKNFSRAFFKIEYDEKSVLDTKGVFNVILSFY